jgi:uncharacterized protein YecT (DUF1311 family)
MNRKLLLSICFLALPGAVSAQDSFEFEEALVEQCFQNAAEFGRSDDCVGMAAGLCMDKNESGWSTYGMMECQGLEIAVWDAKLNAEYQRVLAQAKQMDADYMDVGAAVPSQEEALREMQRAWIAFRDGTCRYERSLWGNGTGGGPASGGCMMRMTAAQAIYLAGQGQDY